MKRCPKCNTVFEDQKRFCGNDGSALVIENPAPPTHETSDDFDDEHVTVIRTEPVNVNFAFPEEIPEAPPLEEDSGPLISLPESIDDSIPLPPKPKSKVLKYALILTSGLFFGGALVLGAVGLGYFYVVSQPTRNSSEANRNKAQENIAPKTANKTSDIKIEVDHSKKNPNADESKLNGSVIKAKVFVRSLPDRTSAKTGLVPQNDRIEIIKRENPTSPWYEIKCEHGVRGWMHGNTIRFIK